MASSAPEYAFLTREGISDSDLKALMLVGIQKLADKREYAQRPPRPIYRVVVSAHGSDTVKKTTAKVSATTEDDNVVFTFQQEKHSLPSYECPQGSIDDLSNSDFRIKLYHIISQIVFENSTISMEAVQEYQRRAFRSLYQRQLQLSDTTDYEGTYGSLTAKTFVDVVNPQHSVTRHYSLLPGSLTGDNCQLEYSDKTKTRVWLLPGITVESRLIELKGSKTLGIECNQISTEYGVFVDSLDSHGRSITGDIFAILENMDRLMDDKLKKKEKDFFKTYKDECACYSRVKSVKKIYDDEVGELNIVQMRSLITKYTTTLSVGSSSTNSSLIDSLMEYINAGNGFRSDGVKTNIGDFFGKFNGNFDVWLKGKMRVDTEIDSFIQAIELLKTSVLLSDGGSGNHIFAQYGITPLHAGDIVKFIRKVFILNEFRGIKFYRSLPKLFISSDDIITILRLHCILLTTPTRTQTTPMIYIMDQVCRVCNSEECARDHTGQQYGSQVVTPKTGRSGNATFSGFSVFEGGMRITKKHKHKRRNTIKKGTCKCKKYKIKLKKRNLTRRCCSRR
jgi:hypothetical protein